MNVARKYKRLITAVRLLPLAFLHLPFLLVGVVAGVIAPSVFTVALTLTIAAANVVLVYSVGRFVGHVWRRGATNRGRRWGWLLYMVVAPWAALPAYYAEAIAPDHARASESYEVDDDIPEVVLPTPRSIETKTSSVSLTGPRAG